MRMTLSIKIVYQVDNNNKIVFLQSIRYVEIESPVLEVEEN